MTPLILGLAGLIPFFAAAFQSHGWLGGDASGTFAMLAFMIYGAVILSFLGGARWGMELARAPLAPHRLRLIGSMVPPIYAWLTPALAQMLSADALDTMIPSIVAALVAVGFILQWAWDEAGGRAGLTPPWYPALRRLLTGGVLASCAVLAASGFPR
jgi:hypothetical protein